MPLNKKDSGTMTSCQYRDSELKSYLSGTLPNLQNDQIQKHLDQCEVCNQRVELLIHQMTLKQGGEETLSATRKSAILQVARQSTFRRNVLRFAALLTVVLGLAFVVFQPTAPQTFHVTTKMNHNYNNHQYIIEISKTPTTNSAETLTTYLIDTSYAIQLTQNFDTLKKRLSHALSNLTTGHKISLIINGGTSDQPNNAPTLLDTQQLLSLIYKTRLKSRPQLMESVDNSLQYITDANVSPENLIIFSNNKAISLATSIQMRLKQESLTKTKLSFALN